MAEKVVETRETEMNEGTEITVEEKNMKERKLSWAKLRRVDSLNIEAGKVSSFQNHASKVSHWWHYFDCFDLWYLTNKLWLTSIFGCGAGEFAEYVKFSVSEHRGDIWGHRDFTAICILKHFPQ